jgi:hypothetical protein
MPDEDQETVVTDDVTKSDADKDMDADFLRALSDVEVDIDEDAPKGDDSDKGKKSGKDGNGKDEPTETEKGYLAEIERLKADKNDLKKALHEERQEKKGKRGSDAEDGKATLSDEQLKSLLEEHRDDPNVLFNIIKFKAEQIARGIKAEALNESEMMQKKAQVDQFMRSRYQDFDDEDSDIRRGLLPIKKAFGLSDHPFGDYFAAGVQVLDSLPQIVKHWYEEGKKAALTDQANDKMKDSIKDGQLLPSKKKADDADRGSQGLTASQMETAKRLGFNTPQQLRLYRDQILRNSPKKKEG